jgi:hypothetical protein
MSETTYVRGKRLVLWVPRVLAALLALGGSFFGVLLSPWIFRPDVSPLALAVFGPGYAITLAYFVRMLSTPSLLIRRMIWVASLVVQGAWTVWYLSAISEKIVAGQSVNEPSLFSAWWVLATVASVIGLITEKGTAEE